MAEEPLGPSTPYTRVAAKGTLLRAIWVALLSFVTLPAVVLMVRTLGRNQYGAFALATTIMALCATISEFGLGASITRMAAHEKDARAMWLRVGLAVAVLTGVTGSVICLLVSLAVTHEAAAPLRVLAVLPLSASLSAVLSGYARAVGRASLAESATGGPLFLYYLTVIWLSLTHTVTPSLAAAALVLCNVVSVVLLFT